MEEICYQGRNGIEALRAPKILKIPSKYEQLQRDYEGIRCVQSIRDYFKDNPYGFEACATDIVSKMDGNFVDFSLTRPWRDGGRDATGYYMISTGGKANRPLKNRLCVRSKVLCRKSWGWSPSHVQIDIKNSI